MALIRTLLLTSVISTLLSLPCFAQGDIGVVEDQTKPSSITRKGENIVGQRGTGIQLNDVVSTTTGKTHLKFRDDTDVNITENSRLLIDNFVYDTNKKTGKLAMKVALGTVRYASGSIAKSNPNNVDIQTPTATIAVRGTDFSMTVDELGRSTIVLLPSCKNGQCITGSIEVGTDYGSVLLNQPYQATTVSSRSAPPTSPKIIKISEENINNNIIISPPKELVRETTSTKSDIKAGLSFLDVDYLKYDKLNQDILGVQNIFTNDLDINRLNVDFLGNILDLQVQSFLQSALSQDALGPLPNIKNFPNIQAAVNDYNITLFKEDTDGVTQVKLDRNLSGNVVIYNNTTAQNVKVNQGGSYQITIKQTNR